MAKTRILSNMAPTLWAHIFRDNVLTIRIAFKMHMQKMSGFPMRRDFLSPFFIPPLNSVIEKPWPFGTLKRKFHQNLLKEYFEDHGEKLLCSSIVTKLFFFMRGRRTACEFWFIRYFWAEIYIILFLILFFFLPDEFQLTLNNSFQHRKKFYSQNLQRCEIFSKGQKVFFKKIILKV